MKRILLALLVAGLVRFAFYEYSMQQSPDSVTDAQISSFQDGVASGCKKGEASRGVEPEKADLACGCLVRVMKQEFTKSEWQRSVVYGRQNNKQEGMEILNAHREKLDVCHGYER